jgi:hypothetical protein
MKSINHFFIFCFVSTALMMPSCKKKDQKNVPTLTTTPASNVTATGLSSGGTISSNGGVEITATGLAYSKTNNMPTITDDTTKTTVMTGVFVSELKNLDPSSTYYIRAYATNSVGTGYGNVITVSSGNAAPEAKNVAISGNAGVGSALKATYTYFDFEGNPESGTSFQWYRADDAAGTGETAIVGATDSVYIISSTDQAKYLRVGVTAKSTAGTASGVEIKSAFTAGIGVQTEVSFYYNNKLVTYGIISSPTTGRKWLDRNLGAANAPTAYDDWANYGDLFQWGRRADGHQLITRTGPDQLNGADVEGTVSPDAPGWIDSDTPPHSKFIIVNGSTGNRPWDWRIPQNNNLWQGVNGINNPCPVGWRIPTKTEFEAETLSSSTDAYDKLKLTATQRRNGGGNFTAAAHLGFYWTSTIVDFPDALGGKASPHLTLNNIAGTAFISISGLGIYHAAANACRCIKD